jgi:hypothetical protein
MKQIKLATQGLALPRGLREARDVNILDQSLGKDRVIAVPASLTRFFEFEPGDHARRRRKSQTE